MSRNTPGSHLTLQRCLKTGALSGCIASLLFPVFAARYSLAATSGSGVIESTAPGAPVDSSIEDSPNVNPDRIEPVSLEDNRFACMNRGGEYTVMYQPESRPGEAFPWAVPRAMGGGWSAESRCFEIARRLEEYRPDGLLELKTGTENGYNILCATTEDNPSCRIVLTVPPNQDPISTRNAVFDNLLVADTGEQTSGVVTYAGGSGGGVTGELVDLGSRLFGSKRNRRTLTSDRGAIQLQPFLDRADGGSATALKNGVRVKNTQKNVGGGGARLNPDQFR